MAVPSLMVGARLPPSVLFARRGAENFAGDSYHTPHTHASVVDIGLFREPKASQRIRGALYTAGPGAGTTYKLPPGGDFAGQLRYVGYQDAMIPVIAAAWSDRQRALVADSGFMVSAATLVTQGNAATPADARAAVQAVTHSFGGLDVLVNCVGIFDFYRGLADLTDDQLDAAFDEIFAVNVKSHLVSVHAALPELRRARGSVVLTVSTSGFYPGRGGVLYVASKFAVRGCVIALAHELAPDVRVNGVAPGGTLGTELTGPRSLGLAEHVLGAAPGREQDLRRRTPLQVALTGADHAGSYVFLASDRACGITGTVLHSDGGIGVR